MIEVWIDKEIIAMAKAGYVVVAAEGQSQENLQRMSQIFLSVIPEITHAHVVQADSISMEEMLNGIVGAGFPMRESMEIFSKFEYYFTSIKATKLVNELRQVVRTRNFSESLMPELAIRMREEKRIWG